MSRPVNRFRRTAYGRPTADPLTLSRRLPAGYEEVAPRRAEDRSGAEFPGSPLVWCAVEHKDGLTEGWAYDADDALSRARASGYSAETAWVRELDPVAASIERRQWEQAQRRRRQR